jgi:hypothetical protein
MWYSNGNLFIGNFLNGVAEGEGYYLDTKGSIYHGQIHNNKANDTNA